MPRLGIAGCAGGEVLAEPGETLLAAVHRHHWQAIAGCRNGNCLSCAAELISGRAVDRQGQPVPPGPILACQTIANGDLQLIWPGAVAPGSATAARTMSCRILSTEPISGGWRSRLELPAGRTPAMLPGQYLLARRPADRQTHHRHAGGQPGTGREAGQPAADLQDRLWVTLPAGGTHREVLVLSGHALIHGDPGNSPKASKRALLEPRLMVEGPFGHCWLDPGAPQPVRLLATPDRRLQAFALRDCCTAWSLAGDGVRPSTVVAMSDSATQRAAWRSQWLAGAAVYADDDGRRYGMNRPAGTSPRGGVAPVDADR